MSFDVDAAAHTYHLDGQRLPSVTDILGLLQNFDSIPWATLERARQRGERVHAMVNAYNRGAFDAGADYPDDVACYLDGWDAFMRETGAVVVASEQPVYHPGLRYAGKPDSVLSWKGGRLLIPDVKATWDVPPTVGAQTAAYAEAYRAQHNLRASQRIDRGCVHLTRDGYEFHPRADSADWSLFVSTLNVYRWLEKNR